MEKIAKHVNINLLTLQRPGLHWEREREWCDKEFTFLWRLYYLCQTWLVQGWSLVWVLNMLGYTPAQQPSTAINTNKSMIIYYLGYHCEPWETLSARGLFCSSRFDLIHQMYLRSFKPLLAISNNVLLLHQLTLLFHVPPLSPQVKGHTCSYCPDIIKAPWKDLVKG